MGPGIPWEEHSSKSEKMETGSDRGSGSGQPMVLSNWESKIERAVSQSPGREDGK